MTGAYCLHGLHPVKSSKELVETKNGALICISCLREQQISFDHFTEPSERDKLLYKLHMDIRVSKKIFDLFDKQLQDPDFRVELGCLIDHLKDKGFTSFEIIDIQTIKSKHKTKGIKLTYRDINGGKKEQRFYVKQLNEEQTAMEIISQQYLDIIGLHRAEVHIYPWMKYKIIYISPEYKDSIHLHETQPLEHPKDKDILREGFAKVQAAWYYYGKTDYLHNQLMSTAGGLHIAQIDHENFGYPLSRETHPTGCDFDWLDDIYSNQDHLKRIIRTLNFLHAGYSSEKGDQPDTEYKLMFLKQLRKIVAQVNGSPKLKRLIEQKLAKGRAIGWHKILCEMIADSRNRHHFQRIFGGEILEIKSLDPVIKQKLIKWRNWAHKQVIDYCQSDQEKAKTERQLIIKRFPHEFYHKDRENNILAITECLEEMGEKPRDILNSISFLRKQLDLSYNTWKSILLQGKIIELAENGVCRN